MKIRETQTLELFPELELVKKGKSKGKTAENLQRLDLHGKLKKKILPLCRLKYGEI